VAITWRLLSHWLAIRAFREQLRSNGCLCWRHNSGFQQTCHIIEQHFQIVSANVFFSVTTQTTCYFELWTWRKPKNVSLYQARQELYKIKYSGPFWPFTPVADSVKNVLHIFQGQNRRHRPTVYCYSEDEVRQSLLELGTCPLYSPGSQMREQGHENWPGWEASE
jgi:hypothetical protein